MLAFGPDKMLYIGIGDGGSGGDPFGHGQDNKVVFGKILRINPRTTPYSIPNDNPFYNQSNVFEVSFECHVTELEVFVFHRVPLSLASTLFSVFNFKN